MGRFLAIAIALALCGVAPPDVGTAHADRASRPLGTRPAKASKSSRRRFRIGKKQHARVRRPSSLKKAHRATAMRRLAAIRRANPKRSLESLLPGYERYRSVRARAALLFKAHPKRVKTQTIATIDDLSVDRIDIKSSVPGAKKVLIIGGIHAGTERVGTEAAMQLAELAAKDPALHGKYDITIIPLLNPSAMVLGTRQNKDNTDVNRTFQAGKWTAESRIINSLPDRDSFDIVLDLHGAGSKGRDGFFAIRGKDDGGMARRFLRAMDSRALVDVPGSKGKGSGRVGPYVFDNLGSAVSATAGTLKGFMSLRAKYVYTLEAPTRMAPERQVKGMVKLVRSALSNLHAHGF